MRRLYRFELIDVLVAMGLASLINMSMLIMAASTFYDTGMTQVATIEEAYRTLEPLLGAAASVIFAISLLASGLSSSSVGTMAGQIIMQGFLHWHIAPWLRRLITMAPALIVIMLGWDPTTTLVLSQVVLSFGLPFAIIPLVMFTRRRDLMGDLVNRTSTTVIAYGRGRADRGAERLSAFPDLHQEVEPMFTHLLVPLDGSEMAESVLPAAVHLARALEARLTLLHVLEHNAPDEVHGQRHITNERRKGCIT